MNTLTQINRMIVIAALMAAAARGDVANDQCITARTVGTAPGAAQGSNLSANPSDDGESTCQPDSQNDVWFAYKALCTGVVTIDTFGSGQSDTVLSVYPSCGGPELVCSDDLTGSLHSELSFSATANETFRIRLASVGAPGDYKLNIACLAPHANDACASASTVTDGTSAAGGNNSLANTMDDAEAGCQEFSGNDVWFAYTATCTGLVTVDALGSGQSDTVLSVYSSCGGAEIGCNDDNSGSLAAQVSFTGTLAQVYRIRLASVGEPGDYRLNIACVGVPANDSCASATLVTDGTPAVVGSNLLGGPVNDVEAACQPLSNSDVWFQYVASCTGMVEVDTQGSVQFDPMLAAYESCAGPELACNDDTAAGLQSALALASTAGQTYRIRLASVGGPGEYTLNIKCVSVPANDNCASATVVTNGSPAATGNNSLADAIDSQESSCQSLSDYDVWFNYVTTCTGAVVVDTMGSAQSDPILSVYDGCSGSEIACVDDVTGSLQPEVSFPSSLGQNFRIRLASVGEPGDYVLNITCVSVPTNDACATALAVTNGAPAAEGNNLLAGSTDDAEAGCQADSSGDVWFKYVSTCAGLVTVDTFGSLQSDIVLSVFDACGGPEITCNDDSGDGLQSSVTVGAMMDQSLWVRLASVGLPGDYQLNIRCVSPPSNDACTSATQISDGAPAAVGNNLLASSTNDGEATCQSNSSGDVWFRYVATCTGSVTIDTIGSGQSDTVLSAYASCGDVEIACNDDDGAGLFSSINFAVTAGASYRVRLASVGAPGDLVVNVACLGVPANDTCATATMVGVGSPAATGNNLLASATDDAAASCGSGPNGDVWFKFQGPCSSTMIIDTLGSEQSDTMVSLYDGCGGAEIACNDDVGGELSSELSFQAVKNQDYWIRVGSIGAPGPFMLNITAPGCRRFGDVDGDQLVNIDDILCVLNAFGGNYTCAGGLGNVDLVPCNGDGLVNIDDILAVLQAFSGVDLCP